MPNYGLARPLLSGTRSHEAIMCWLRSPVHRSSGVRYLRHASSRGAVPMPRLREVAFGVHGASLRWLLLDQLRRPKEAPLHGRFSQSNGQNKPKSGNGGSKLGRLGKGKLNAGSGRLKSRPSNSTSTANTTNGGNRPGRLGNGIANAGIGTCRSTPSSSMSMLNDGNGGSRLGTLGNGIANAGTM
jgi:hypothetical protein